MLQVVELHLQHLHFGVATGHHIHLKANVEGMEIARSYTPVMASLVMPSSYINRRLHLLIKTYDNGALTPHIKSLKIGN